MALVGKLIVENFTYGVSEVEFPLFENDEPLMDGEEQKTATFKVISIDALPGAQLEIRVPLDNWDQFLKTLATEKPES